MELECVAKGIYLSPDAWEDPFYLLQTRYPQIIFSHETSLYLLGMAEREPLQFTVTVKAGYHAKSMKEQKIKVYRVKRELLELGVVNLESPEGHLVKAYNAERTVCDLLRSRSNVEISGFTSDNKGIPAKIRKKICRTYAICKRVSCRKNFETIFGGIVIMIKTSRQLKALVRNLTKGDSLQAQIIMRNYVMERFLERISLSKYRNNFILKGGMLVSAMVGLDTRSTMDIDTTIKNMPLSVENAREMIEEMRMDLLTYLKNYEP